MLLSVLLGRNLGPRRATADAHGSVLRTGSFTHLPQLPIEHGLGVEPIGLSHVLSARGLDRLDAEVHSARAAMAADPTGAAIERFSDLEMPPSPSGAATSPRARWRASRRASACARSSSWRTSRRCRAASAGASTSCGPSTSRRGRSCSTSPPTTSTGRPSSGCSASSPRCPAPWCSSATTSPSSTRPSTRCCTSKRGLVNEYKGNYFLGVPPPVRRSTARATELLASREDAEIKRLR